MNGAAVSWASTLQPTVAQSTTEAEYMAAAAACKEALWDCKLRRDMQLRTEGSTQLWGDNQGALTMVKDPVLHARIKHVHVHHYAVCQYCHNTDMIADALTKGLAQPALEKGREGMGLIPVFPTFRRSVRR
jgi:hypothetical protein